MKVLYFILLNLINMLRYVVQLVNRKLSIAYVSASPRVVFIPECSYLKAELNSETGISRKT